MEADGALGAGASGIANADAAGAHVTGADAAGADAAAIANKVRRFYERHPYPPPVDDLERYRLLWHDRQRRRADHHLFWPTSAYRDDHAILIAGCGTSQGAKHALRWPRARITAIDFSETSVRCSEAFKQKYGLDNLQVRQLPIERVTELGATFDQIVCTGVLHHLADPDAALEALRDVLAPGGAMHLMVYAPYGRTGVYMLQEFCQRVGIEATAEGIRDLVVALGALPAGHPLASLLREAPDFRQEAALADALLHPHDRAYAVPQLFDLLQRGRLTFGRWVKQAPYDPLCGVTARLPQSARIARLPPAERYAAVELFRGTMVRHSLVAYRDDEPGASQQPGLSGDGWPAYVPVRMPDTICVQERLPPGAAAVLINRGHTSTDIYLPIDALEQRLFDAIDGQRSIGEIARTRAPLATARALFERLYRHDQVVFDASPSSP
jgi:SAM-dependent methyltransferase